MITEHLEILCKLQMQQIEYLNSKIKTLEKIDLIKLEQKKEHNKNYRKKKQTK